jgi:hypothetical protein
MTYGIIIGVVGVFMQSNCVYYCDMIVSITGGLEETPL